LRNVQQNRLNRCTLKLLMIQLLVPNPQSNVMHFLYVPLPVFSGPDDVGWLRMSEQSGKSLKLSETVGWKYRALKLGRYILLNL